MEQKHLTPPKTPPKRKVCPRCREQRHINQFGAHGQAEICLRCAIEEEHANKGWARSDWGRS
jgi:hypothetical protein